ncbi:MAG: hypothetical protein GY725_13335 [bacterium]|nr:hypothetical protein [bacterium]
MASNFASTTTARVLRHARLFAQKHSLPLFRQKHQEQSVTGVCLFSDGFGIARVSRDEDGVPILEACEYREHQNPDEIPNALSEVVGELGLRGSECVCIPKPGTYTVRQIERPKVEPAELRDAARWAIADLIDFNAADAVIDTFDIPACETRKNAPERLYVVAARKMDIDSAATTIRRAGLELKAIDITELALNNVAALLPEDEPGVALMYLSTDPGLIGVTRNGALLLTRSIEADPLAIEDLSTHELDEIKADPSAEGQQVLEGFLLEAQRSLDYVEHQLGQPVIPNLAIAPLEWPTPALPEFLSQNLFSTEVSCLDVNDLLTCRNKVGPTAQARSLPAIGAALRVDEDG